ncbi:MAG: hypothetical protein WC205_03415 [Opitutaceae bacterium]|jgi:hypothetical protein
MNDPASDAPSSLTLSPKKSTRATFLPSIINTVAFYIIALCILASVVVCILAIWDFAQRDTLWRLATSFLVIAAGTGLFAFLNVKFGERKDS